MAIKTYTLKQVRRLKDRTDWDYIRNMKDEDVDYSDIPEVTDDILHTMKVYENGELLKRTNHKTSVNLKLDDEILDFFKGKGADWENRINEALIQVVNMRNIFA